MKLNFVKIARALIFFSFLFTTSLSYAIPHIVVENNKQGALPPAQLGISPPRIEHTINVKKNEHLNSSITIYNYNSKPKEIVLELFDVNSKLKPIRSNNKTLVPWTILNPKKFTIPGNGQQTVRFSMRPPANFPKKTHFVILQIKEFIKDPVKYDTDGKGVTVNIGASYGIPIIVHVK